MRRASLFLILIAGIAFLPTFSSGQQFGGGGKGNKGEGGGGKGGGGGFGGGGGGGKGGGGGGFKMPTADESFDRFSGGKDVIIVSELDATQKQRWQFSSNFLKLTGDRITREEFKAASEKMMSQFQQGGNFPKKDGESGQGGGPGGGSFGGPGGFQPKGGQSGDGPPKDKGGNRRGNPDTMAEEIFKRSDRNEDGLLSFEEMSETLQRERDTYDTNKDGFIDLAEFKVYWAARMVKRDNPQGQEQPKTDDKKGTENLPVVPETHQPYKEDARAPVFRVGKLPKELPEWFIRLDKEGDNDGQVGLYEWKSLGKGLDEFMAMDLNGDGLLTAEEYLRWKASQIAKKPSEGELAVGDGSNSEDRMPSRSGSQGSDGSGSPRFNGLGGGNNNGGVGGGNRFGGFQPKGGDNAGGGGGNRFGGFGPPGGGDNSGGGNRFGGFGGLQPKGGDTGGGNRFGGFGGAKGGDNGGSNRFGGAKGGDLSNGGGGGNRKNGGSGGDLSNGGGGGRKRGSGDGD